ncbi:MAG: hypothetical protein EHM79_07725 [Geobacter sp.]|nr:MAG: hypothetical protein EHM79_07725 [Geobacter sp.]
MQKTKRLFKKFVRSPIQFFADARKNRLRRLKIKSIPTNGNVITTYVIGFSTWKQYLRKYFPDRNLVFLPKEISREEFDALYRKKILASPDAEIFIWGFKAPDYLLKFIEKNNIKVFFVEDGFVRSVQLGATKAPPFSLCLDSRTPYFNARQGSDLEELLCKYDFNSDPTLMERAGEAIKLLLDTGVSKYNSAKPTDVDRIYGKKIGKRILVLGQVEEDASIEYGCDKPCTNNDVVVLAAKENPGAQIIYKPHPDVINGHRPNQSNPADVRQLCLILEQDIPLAQAFATIDHVYTITSLGGFEALLRGISVTTLGCPFYAGWGLTDDRQFNSRRTRPLNIQQVFAGAYLLYAKYFDPETGARLELVDVVRTLLHQKNESLVLAANHGVNKLSAIADNTSIPTYIIGDTSYKHLLSIWFPGRKFVHIPSKVSPEEFISKYKKRIQRNPQAEIFLFGGEPALFLRKFIAQSDRKVSYVEDGFLGSRGLLATKSPSFSQTLDNQAPYFDASKTSDLECLLNEYDFAGDEALLERADKLIATLIELGLSKYNHVSRIDDIQSIYGSKEKRRILVLGQAEGEASVKLGNPRGYTNNDVVMIASLENPGAQIIFKPHPDVLSRHRSAMSDPGKVKHLCLVMGQDVLLDQALETIDHVYTITSLAGFEALIRGIKVTVLGCPFYAGWGLTDDRQENARRKRKLSLREVFAAAYVLYSKYVDPLYRMEISPEVAFDRISNQYNQLLQAKRKSEEIRSASNAIKNLNNDSAIEFLKTALLNGQNNCDIWNGLAEAYTNKGMYNEAIDAYTNSLTHSEGADIYLKRAKVRLKSGDFSQTTDYDFKKSLEMSPTKNDILYSYFSYRWEAEPLTENMMRDFESALNNLSSKQKEGRAYGKLLLLYAAMLNEIGRKTEATKIHNRAISMGGVDVTLLPLRYTAYGKGNNKAVTPFEAENFKKLLKYRERFKELVLDARGSVCVVGNSPSMLGGNKGAEIDQRDLVVRFNSYSTDYPYCEDCGVKTDVWVRMPFHPYVRKELDPALKLVIFSGSNRLHRPYTEWPSILEYVASGYPVQFFPPEYFYELQSMLGSPPTSGLMMCYMLYKIIGPLKPENYCGFSFTDDVDHKSAYHYSDLNASASLRHSWDKEAEVFKGMKAAPNAKVLVTRTLLFRQNAHDSETREQLQPAVQKDFAVNKTEFDRVISVSPGLGEYSVFGKSVELLSPAKAEKHLALLRGEKGGEESSILSGIGSSDRVCFLGFGRARTGIIAQDLANYLNVHYRLVEYGLISSMHLPSEKQYNFSLILDDRGIFYDTTRPSLIEEILFNNESIRSEFTKTRSKKLIRMIVDNNITKYNNSPDITLPEKSSSKKRILVVDQTANDNSIIYGQCSRYSFKDMLDEALQDYNAEVILKLHPETAAGAKGGNFDLAEISADPRILVISQQCNIISLIKQVDEVFVMTSGVGLEALLVGKPVTSFGVPFYAGWGLTKEMTEVHNPRRKLTLEELFAGVFLEYTSYFHPDSHAASNLEECLEWIIAHKNITTSIVTEDQNEERSDTSFGLYNARRRILQ